MLDWNYLPGMVGLLVPFAFTLLAIALWAIEVRFRALLAPVLVIAGFVLAHVAFAAMAVSPPWRGMLWLTW